jgi:hypothetical protein
VVRQPFVCEFAEGRVAGIEQISLDPLLLQRRVLALKK